MSRAFRLLPFRNMPVAGALAMLQLKLPQDLVLSRLLGATTIRGAIAATVLAVCGPVVGAAESGPAGSGVADRVGAADANAVQLFDAMSQELIDVKIVPKDATQATLIVRNQGDKPLRVQLPAAFAGVPVLAQIGNNGGGGNNTGGGNQSFGGGGGGFGGGGFGGGGGFFNVGPEGVRRIKLATVCLEHGKEDPNPRVAYKIVPISQFTTDQRVHAVCAMLGRNQLDQATAQAAAWHLTDKLSWQELSQKLKAKHLDGSVETYFNPQQLSLAAQAVAAIAQHVEKETQSSPGDTPTSDEPVEPRSATDVER